MKNKKVVFMGTPEYSVPVLEMLIYLIDPFYLYFLSYNNSCLWICFCHPTALTV